MTDKQTEFQLVDSTPPVLVKLFMFVFTVISFFQHPFIRFSNKWQVVPKSDERDSKEKAESSSKVSHQGGKGVDQLLRLERSLL